MLFNDDQSKQKIASLGGITTRLKNILSWPEFRIFWLILFLLLLTFGVSAVFLTPKWLLLIQGGLVLGIISSAFAGMYLSAKSERENIIERNELRNIIFGLEDSLVVYDTDFKILFFNPAAEKFFNVKAAEILGNQFQPQYADDPKLKLLAQVIFPSLAPAVISRSGAGEYPQVVDVSFSDPKVLNLRIITSPVSDEGGRLLGFMKIVHNRTRELSAIRSKSEFLTIASHQLRSPATDVSWALETLNADDSIKDTSKKILEAAFKASSELLRIIEDLLSVAKIEEGRFGYDFKQTNIVEFITGILGQISPAARKVGVKIYLDTPKVPLPEVVVDAQKLTLALKNILENGVRYNVENGEVVVKVEKVENQPYLEVSVRDTGIGIPRGDMDKLFNKFFRSELAIKAQTEGSGLGLYITRSVIQAHGGRIWAESEENRGSVFHFTLPMDTNLIPRHEISAEDI